MLFELKNETIIIWVLAIAFLGVWLFAETPMQEQLMTWGAIAGLTYGLIRKVIRMRRPQRELEFRFKTRNDGFQKSGLIMAGLLLIGISLTIPFIFTEGSFNYILIIIGTLLIGNGLAFRSQGYVKIQKEMLLIVGIREKIPMDALAKIRLRPDSLTVRMVTEAIYDSRNLILTAEIVSGLIIFLEKNIDPNKIEISEKFSQDRLEVFD